MYRCYSIEEETFLQTKLIAGKIIPAIATTTTTVSAAVMIELIKIVQQRPIQAFKTLYLDLAFPTFTHYEPNPPRNKAIEARPASSNVSLSLTSALCVSLSDTLSYAVSLMLWVRLSL